MFVRKGIPADDYVVGEVPTYSKFVIREGDRVLDLGANIGAMSQRFLKDGAELVVSVEPFPDNVLVLRKNLEAFDSLHYVILQAAVVGPDTGPELTLYTPDTNFGMVSRVKHDVPYAVLTGAINVPTVQFDDLVERYEPTAIKCDIEGGEYDFLPSLLNLPASVTRLAIEWHHFQQDLETGGKESTYLMAQERLRKQGFRAIAGSGAFLPNEHSARLCIYSRET